MKRIKLGERNKIKLKFTAPYAKTTIHGANWCILCDGREKAIYKLYNAIIALDGTTISMINGIALNFSAKEVIVY